MNYKINWYKLTESEALDILTGIGGKFNLIAKSKQDNKMHDIAYIEVRGIYDDNLHAVNNCEEDDEDIENGPLEKPISEYIKDIAGVSDDLKG